MTTSISVTVNICRLDIPYRVTNYRKQDKIVIKPYKSEHMNNLNSSYSFFGIKVIIFLTTSEKRQTCFKRKY